MAQDAERKACLRALFLSNPQDTREDLIRNKGERSEGTCEWILSNERYLAWARDTKPHLLWISGRPGKGKTMLSIFLTQELERPLLANEVALYFFCANGDEKRNHSTAILRGLIFQFVDKRPSLLKHILPRFELEETSLFESTSIDSLWRIFEAMLLDPSLDTVHCCLDGLDECDEESAEGISKKINRLFESTCGDKRLKFILTSRAEPPSLCRELSKFPRIDLDSSTSSVINADIQKLIYTEVDKLAKEKNYSDELRNLVSKALQDGSEGSFLWVGFIIHDLRKKTSLEVLTAIKQLPRGLEEMYDRILIQILPDRRAIAARILRWVAIAVRPFTLAELASAFSIQPAAGLDPVKVMREQVEFCGYFLRMHKHKPWNNEEMPVDDWPVTLLHQSAKDYLLATSPIQWPELKLFRFDQAEIHNEIADTCLNLLESIDITEMPPDQRLEVCSGEKSRTSASLLKNDDCHCDGFLHYAFLNWMEHVRAAHGCSIDFTRPFYRTNSQSRRAWASLYSSIDPQLGSNPTLLHLGAFYGIRRFAEKLLHVRKPLMSLPKGQFLAIPREIATQQLRLINQLDGNNHNALYYAATKGFVKIVEIVLSQGAALLREVQRGSTSAARSIWKASLNIDAAEALGESVKHDNREVFELLLQSEARFDLTLALTEAVRRNDYQIVIRLLKTGKSFDGTRALLWAVFHQNENILELLLAYGAKENFVSAPPLNTALCHAIKIRSSKVVKLLLSNRAVEVNPDVAQTPLFLAIIYNETELVEELLKAGAQVNRGNMAYYVTRPDFNRNTSTNQWLAIASPPPLLQAINLRYLKIVNLLLANGANVNPSCMPWYHPLTAAVRYSDIRLVQLLLQNGANPNPTKHPIYNSCDDNKQPLFVAVEHGLLDIAELLLQHGAEVNPEESCPQLLPLYQAVFRYNLRMMKLLIEHGAKVDVDTLPRIEWDSSLSEFKDLVPFFKYPNELGISDESPTEPPTERMDFCSELDAVDTTRIFELDAVYTAVSSFGLDAADTEVSSFVLDVANTEVSSFVPDVINTKDLHPKGKSHSSLSRMLKKLGSFKSTSKLHTSSLDVHSLLSTFKA